MVNTKVLSREEALDLNKKLRNELFLVDVNFRKAGHEITISPKLLGVDIDGNDDLQSFFSDFVRNNRVSFLKKNVTQKADNVAKSAHKEKRARALGSSNNFMTAEVMKEYQEYLEKKKEEYFKARDEIMDEYDFMVESFKIDFKNKLINQTLSTLSEKERDEIMAKVFKRIPTAKEYANSFKVGMTRTKISLAGEVDHSQVDDVIQDTLEQVNEITGKNLNIAFTTLNTLMSHYHENGMLNGRNRAVFTTVPKELKKRNLFNDAIVEEVAKKLTDFKLNKTSDDLVIEESEMLVSKIYGYAVQIGVEDELDLSSSVLNVDEMMDIFEIFNESEDEVFAF